MHFPGEIEENSDNLSTESLDSDSQQALLKYNSEVYLNNNRNIG